MEAIPRLNKFNTNLHPPILLLQTSEEYIREALRVGARGNMVKCADPSELELASNLSYEGRFTSPCQRDIIQLIAEGRITKDIAQLLDLSIKTIETHRTELMKRLDIHDVAGLVRYTIRRGLISPET